MTLWHRGHSFGGYAPHCSGVHESGGSPGAHFGGAHLQGANFVWAELDGADFWDFGRLGDTVIEPWQLADAKGLDTVMLPRGMSREQVQQVRDMLAGLARQAGFEQPLSAELARWQWYTETPPRRRAIGKIHLRTSRIDRKVSSPPALAKLMSIEHSASKIRQPGDRASADFLLAKVHRRIGLGIDIQTFSEGGDEAVWVHWKRDYDGEWSDERAARAPTLKGALQAILDYEDEADAHDAAEAERLGSS